MKYRHQLQTLIVLLSIAIFLNACKKDSDKPASYIKFKKDGEWFTYTYKTEGWYDGNNVVGSVTLRSFSADSTSSFIIYISNSASPNLVGSFTSNSPKQYISIFYENDYTSVLYFINNFSGMPPSNYTVTITSITDAYIEGYFVGNYLSNDPIVGGFLKTNITEGEFKVKRIK